MNEVRRGTSPYGDLLEWLEHKGIRLTGVLHIGANKGQEAGDYAAAGCKVIWIEGDPEVFDRLRPAIAGYSAQQAYCCLCSDVDGQPVKFHIASNDGGSSSVLPPNDGVFAVFGVQMVATRELITSRLDTYFAKHGVSIDGFNLINIDVQGFELPVLRGVGKQIDRFDAVIAELNWAAAYQGATRPHALEFYLAGHGFRRSWLSVGYPQGVGIWVRKPMSAIRRISLYAGIWMVEILSALGLFRALQGTRVRSMVRKFYYRLKRRSVGN